MKAIAVDRAGELHLRDVPEPQLAPGHVLVRTTRVGICATDREMVRTKTIYAIPEGEDHLVLGHEGIGVVEAVGEGVSGFAPGDVVVPSCYIQWPVMEGRCRVDMCPYGLELRRGINAHGYFRERFLERPDYLLKVPAGLEQVGMLLEPLTVTLKGFEAARLLRDRWLGMPCAARPKDRRERAMVIGAGPIGMLGIMLARSWGWETVGVDAVPEDSLKAQLVCDVGAHYVDARSTTPAEIRERFGEFDIVLEAVQDPTVLLSYVDLLGTNGVFVVIGWTATGKEVTFDLGNFLLGLLEKQISIVSSTGAGMPHYVEGMDRLAAIKATYGDVLERMVTASLPFTEYADGFARGGPNEIKTVLEFAGS